MSQGAKGVKKNMEVASASSTEHRINLILRLSSMLLLSKIVKLRSIYHLVNYVLQLFTGDHHLKNTKSLLVNSLINSVNFSKNMLMVLIVA